MDTPKFRVRPLTRLAGVLLAAGTAMAALSCGEVEGPDVESPTGSPGNTTIEPTTPPETTDLEESTPMPEESTPYLDPSAGSTDKSGGTSEMTITGTIESGVESGCLIMNYEGKVYGIFGSYDESVVYAGAEVTLSGYLDPEMMSFCQQGTPFVVEEAQSAD